MQENAWPVTGSVPSSLAYKEQRGKWGASVHSRVIKVLTITSEIYLLLVISKQINIKFFN